MHEESHLAAFDQQIAEEIHKVSGQIAQKAQDFEAASLNPLLSPETKRRHVQLEEEQALAKYLIRLALGLREFATSLEIIAPFAPDLFTAAVTSKIRELTTNVAGIQMAALSAYRGEPLKEIFGLDDTAILALYRLASEIYNQHKFSEAAATLSVITLLDPTIYDAWVSLGHAEYFSQRYTSALVAYAQSVQVDPSNPKCHLYAAHCYEALKQYDHAMNSLDIALYVMQAAKGTRDFAGLVDKAKEHQAHLQSLIKKDQNTT